MRTYIMHTMYAYLFYILLPETSASTGEITPLSLFCCLKCMYMICMHTSSLLSRFVGSDPRSSSRLNVPSLGRFSFVRGICVEACIDRD
jgi:hypothetical protein